MKILISCGRVTPPLFLGGAEVSSRTLARQLLEHGHIVIYLGSYTHPKHGTQMSLLQKYIEQLKIMKIDVTGSNHGKICYNFEGVTCGMMPFESLIENFLQQIEKSKPDLVITMLEGAADIVQICQYVRIPCVVWIHDVYPVGLQALIEKPTMVLYTSNFVRKRGLLVSGIDGLIFYPPFEYPKQRFYKKTRCFITMINPIPEKGGHIFLELARLFPEKEFLAVEGWRQSELWQNKVPPNVCYRAKQYDLSSVWQNTRVLLVPSKMEEGFGRVIIEAAYHGIPSIASSRGGLPEAVGESGVLISCDTIKEWVDALIQIDDTKLWSELSLRCYSHAEQFYGDSVLKLVKAGILKE